MQVYDNYEEKLRRWNDLRGDFQRKRRGMSTQGFQDLAARAGSLHEPYAQAGDYLEAAIEELTAFAEGDDPNDVMGYVSLGYALTLLAQVADSYGYQLFEAGVDYLAGMLAVDLPNATEGGKTDGEQPATTA